MFGVLITAFMGSKNAGRKPALLEYRKQKGDWMNSVLYQKSLIRQVPGITQPGDGELLETVCNYIILLIDGTGMILVTNIHY
jgi:hypothetical protein